MMRQFPVHEVQTECEVERSGHHVLHVLHAGFTVQANPEESFIDMLNALQKALAGAGFISSGDGTNDDGPGDGDAGGSGPSAKEYWISDVDPIMPRASARAVTRRAGRRRTVVHSCCLPTQMKITTSRCRVL